MLLLADTVELGQFKAWSVPVPLGLIPEWTTGRTAKLTFSGRGGLLHDTVVRWIWRDDKAELASSTFKVFSGPGGFYANSLLDVLEAGFTKGRQTVDLPDELHARAEADLTLPRE